MAEAAGVVELEEHDDAGVYEAPAVEERTPVRQPLVGLVSA